MCVVCSPGRDVQAIFLPPGVADLVEINLCAKVITIVINNTKTRILVCLYENRCFLTANSFIIWTVYHKGNISVRWSGFSFAIRVHASLGFARFALSLGHAPWDSASSETCRISLSFLPPACWYLFQHTAESAHWSGYFLWPFYVPFILPLTFLSMSMWWSVNMGGNLPAA